MLLIAKPLNKLTSTITMLKMKSANTMRLQMGYAVKGVSSFSKSNSPVSIMMVLKSERQGLENLSFLKSM